MPIPPNLPRGRSCLGKGPALLWAAIACLFMGLTIRYIQEERFFYFWDSFAYHRAALESISALRQPDTSWLQYLRVSMQSGFSQMFTITLAPLMVMLGEGRVVFIAGIVGFYLLPCAVLGTLIVNRMIPLQRWQWPMVFTACTTLPVLWRASLSGYPDIGGLALALGAFLMITSDLGYKKWRTAIGMGALLAGIFLFRRHLIYCVIPLMAATSGLSSAYCLLEKGPQRWRQALGAVLRIGCTTVLTVFLIWLVAPNYFRELISNNYRDLYLPYQATVHTAFRTHLNYVGLFYWALGGLGLIWGIARGGKTRWICALLMIYSIISYCIWFFYLRYLGVQYNLHFGVITSVAIGLLVALMSTQPRRWIPSTVLTVVLMSLWLDRLSFLPFSPPAMNWALPARIPPLKNPDYDAIKRLIVFLHDRVTAPQNNILVAASSQTMNSDMLTIGEKALYGSAQCRLAIMNGSHVDTVQPYPLRDMIAADWIIVADPFQHHLRVEDQGVVLSIHEAMLTQSPFSTDFQRVETTFSLSNGISLSLFKRFAPTSFRTQVETAKRVFDSVGVADAWTGPFMMGQAATGAEYYDARLIIPRGSGQYTVDLEQVRLLENQSAVTLFVRLPDKRKGILVGTTRGPNDGSIEIQAELFPDSSASNDAARWSGKITITNGQPFEIQFPANGSGILALHLSPHIKPALGSPLGIIIDNLNVQ